MLLKVSHRWWCLTMFLHLLFMCQIQPWSSSMTVEKRGTFTSNDRRHPWTAGVTFSHLYTNKYYYSILGSHDNNYLHDNWTTPTAEESNVMCLKASETISKLDHVLITKKIKTIRDLLYILLYITDLLVIKCTLYMVNYQNHSSLKMSMIKVSQAVTCNQNKRTRLRLNNWSFLYWFLYAIWKCAPFEMYHFVLLSDYITAM